jgi:hypothetical protein
MPVAGNNGLARHQLIQIANLLGFKTADFEPLASARYLEPFTMAWLQLSVKLGWGREFGFGRFLGRNDMSAPQTKDETRRRLNPADYGASTAPVAAHEQTDSSDAACLMLQVMPLSELVIVTLLVMALLILAVVLYPA